MTTAAPAENVTTAALADPAIVARPTTHGRAQLRVKHAADRVLAAFLLLLLLPVLFLVAGAVWLSLRWPILYKQARVGQYGRVFPMLKFRTMAEDAEFVLGGGAELSFDFGPGGVEGRDRRSTIGRWLRATSLDELPQLWNVLKGDMSLIGPRPERPEFVTVFEREIKGYGDRHRLRVGMTGLAQVSGLYGRTSISARCACDNAYIDHFSLLLDLRIVLRTFGTLLRRVRNAE